MNKTVELKVLQPAFYKYQKLPEYATEHSVGMDLRACLKQSLTVFPQTTELVSTGIAINMLDSNMAAMIHPRSGLGHKHGIVLGNLTGIIDSDYQGELFVSIWNRNRYENSQEHYTIEPGDRIAQLMFVPIIRVDFNVVEEFEESDRGEGGFGSTGKS